MLLWDDAIRPLKDEIDGLRALPRLEITVNALSWTIRTMVPPIEEQSVVDFASDVLDYLEQQIRQGNASPEFITDLEERHEGLLDEEIVETGVDPILSAITACFGYREPQLRTQTVYYSLSSCYQAQFQRIAPDMATIEFERDSARCSEIIDFQKTLIRRSGHQRGSKPHCLNQSQ
ncbi:hypothetical protein OIE68_20980 [Nocardia vinacea]|uniref:hypothetical protein n=1 Tax=Nocardia vinacea TaxID=96468 RepID=UPI002E12B580|nr:hypothetical protein OIE68_20980 [Nocardia vinacea]